MKPSTALALRLLREHDSVTTHDLLVAGVGSRYSARIHELRHEHGCVIEETRLKGDVSGSRYRLIAEPDLQDPPREGDGASTFDAASTETRGRVGIAVAAVSRDDGGCADRVSGAHLTGPGRVAADQATGRLVDSAVEDRAEFPRDAVSPAGSRPAGVLFDPAEFERRPGWWETAA